jgi:uncharacterized phage-associated protein
MKDSFQLIEIFHVQSTDLKMNPSFSQKIKAWESQPLFPSLLDVRKSNEWSDD